MILDLLRELVGIDSVNPELVPGGAGEVAIADHCARWFGERGFEVHRLEERPGRPSIVAIARGSGGGRSLMFNGHLDTVGLAGYDGDPLAAEERDGRIHGRGTFDMKGGLAAMMVAAHEAKQLGLRGDVLVACVADEEFGSHGTEEVLRHFTADAAIVAEPSNLELTVAHKGFAWFEVEIEGRAAHGSRPDLGIDAIVKAGHFLVALEEWQRRLGAGDVHPLLGAGSVHASTIDGGQEASTYPARCRVTLERRTVPGETTESVRAELEALLDGLVATVPDFRYRVVQGLGRPPFQADRESPIVACLAAQAEKELGHPPVIRGEPFWTDCALYDAAGIPCVLYGAGGAGAHAATEWADAASVERLARIFTATIADFCA
ncbi:ArgE/DapE family deacylase [Nonomuraea sediminis]|uniref:ArgE/DapE family deacylase n=1 Tax=Nonomuraea sediminis TaxID=2835864 RepID=UPI001BDC0ED8|nr:ArgE/DapE family deacylase [Nonomuraea sediminis]